MKLDLLLKRLFSDEEGNFILGELQDENKKIGDTLENLVDCIAVGRYQVILNYSPKFKKVLPLIMDSTREGIRFHQGNTSKDVSGCILLGENTQPGWISETKVYIPKLIDMIDNATTGQTYLTIVKEGE